MDMASIAKGFGVSGEVVDKPAQLIDALKRARAATVEGKPYLIDVQVARSGGPGPWTPPIRIAELRQRKV